MTETEQVPQEQSTNSTEAAAGNLSSADKIKALLEQRTKIEADARAADVELQRLQAEADVEAARDAKRNATTEKLNARENLIAEAKKKELELQKIQQRIDIQKNEVEQFQALIPQLEQMGIVDKDFESKSEQAKQGLAELRQAYLDGQKQLQEYQAQQGDLVSVRSGQEDINSRIDEISSDPDVMYQLEAQAGIEDKERSQYKPVNPEYYALVQQVSQLNREKLNVLNDPEDLNEDGSSKAGKTLSLPRYIRYDQAGDLQEIELPGLSDDKGKLGKLLKGKIPKDTGLYQANHNFLVDAYHHDPKVKEILDAYITVDKQSRVNQEQRNTILTAKREHYVSGASINGYLESVGLQSRIPEDFDFHSSLEAIKHARPEDLAGYAKLLVSIIEQFSDLRLSSEQRADIGVDLRAIQRNIDELIHALISISEQIKLESWSDKDRIAGLDARKKVDNSYDQLRASPIINKNYIQSGTASLDTQNRLWLMAGDTVNGAEKAT